MANFRRHLVFFFLVPGYTQYVLHMRAHPTPRSNAGACAMHLYPVAGRENFPRENLIETIAETGVTRKKVERQ